MSKHLSQEQIEYLIAKVLDNAKDAFQEARDNKGDAFFDGRRLAYYEVIDTIKNQLRVDGADLKEFGLEINLETLAG